MGQRDGKIAIVTGGAMGIGYAVAQAQVVLDISAT